MDPSSMYLQPSHIGGEDRYNMQVRVNTFHLRLNAITALRVLLHNCTRSIKTHTMIHYYSNTLLLHLVHKAKKITNYIKIYCIIVGSLVPIVKF